MLQIYALKRVRLGNSRDAEAIQGFIDEISLLKKLRNTANIIQLVNAQVFREQVCEKGQVVCEACVRLCVYADYFRSSRVICKIARFPANEHAIYSRCMDAARTPAQTDEVHEC